MIAFEFIVELHQPGQDGEPRMLFIKTNADNELIARRAVLDKYFNDGHAVRRLVRVYVATTPAAG